MKKFFIFALLLFFLQSPARSVAGILIGVDENGNGFYSINEGHTIKMPGSIQKDPLSGLLALAYNLPAGAMATDGDLNLLEPGITFPAASSDFIRFKNNTLLFFSDIVPGDKDKDKADVNIFPTRQANVIKKSEVGTDANNGIKYVPTKGQPGFGPNGNVFLIKSDGNGGPQLVPEPSTMMLAAAGGGLFLLYYMRRIKRGRMRSSFKS